MSRGAVNLGIVSKFDNKGVSKARKAFKKFGGAAAGIATGAVAAIGGIATAATRMASEFETSFAKIEGLVGVSTAEIGKLEEAAIELGPKFGKSAQEAADALFFITSAGLEGEDAINVLEASLKGAAIGLGDTSTIADLATSAVNAYGASQLDGAKAVDVLTEAVREGKLEPAELAGAMGQVLPMASALGIGFDEVGAAMAAMSRTGTDAATASTQLRGILNSVIKPTSEAEATLSGLGLSAEGLREQMGSEGLLPTLETLTTAFDGNIEATADVFGNVRALTGVMDLMGTNVDSTREIFGNMTDDVLVLDDALGITQETAANKFAVAMETAKAALLPVGDTLLDIGASLLEGLMPTIELLGPLFEETFAQLEQPLANLAGLLPGLLEALMPVLPVLGQLAAIFVDLVVALLPPLVALFELLIPIIGFLLEAIQAFIVPLVEMLAPILTKIIELFIPLIEAILPIFMILLEALLQPTLDLIEALIPFYEAVLPLLADVIENVVVPALGLFAEWLEVWLPGALDFLQNSGLVPFLGAFDVFAASIKNGTNGLEVTIAEMINGVIASFEAGVKGAVRAAGVIIQAMKKIPATAATAFALEKVLPSPGDINFGRMEVPDRIYEFPEIDVEGISDSLTRRSGQFDTFGTGALLKRADELNAARESFARTLDLKPRSEMSMRERAALLPFGGGQALIPGPVMRDDFVPAMAKGGIVDGPTLALIGEAGPEAVIPLDKMDRMGGGDIYITVNAGMGTSGPQVGEQIVAEIKRYERSSGRVFQSA